MGQELRFTDERRYNKNSENKAAGKRNQTRLGPPSNNSGPNKLPTCLHKQVKIS